MYLFLFPVILSFKVVDTVIRVHGEVPQGAFFKFAQLLFQLLSLVETGTNMRNRIFPISNIRLGTTELWL